MSTHSQILYQIVFATKNRENTLTQQNREILYRYIWGILNNKKCHLYRVGGIANHIHIVTHLHPSVSLSSLVKDIKIASAQHIKTHNLFEGFTGWQEGYGAFTYSIKEKDNLIEYVRDQERHHSTKTFREELIELLNEHQIDFKEEYLF